MENVIYLNGLQVTLLEEQGYPLTQITMSILENALFRNDLSNIYRATAIMCSTNGILGKMGLQVSNPPAWLKCSDTDLIGVDLTLPKNTMLNAVMSTDKTLIVYPVEVDVPTAFDLHKQSKFNILKVISKTMIFKQLKHTNFFKSVFLSEGN